MANPINPNLPPNLPPTASPTGPTAPPVMTVESMEETLRNSGPEQITSMRTLFVQQKKIKASQEALEHGQDPNQAMRAVDNDPTVKHLDDMISEYEAGRALLPDLAAAFVAVHGSG